MTDLELNLQKCDPDPRDYVYDNELMTPRAVTYMCEGLSPVRNQGSQGTCAAQVACCMKEYQERRNVNFIGYFSPQFLYNIRPRKNDPGMNSREIMDLLRRIGVVPEAQYLYGRDDIPSADLIERAGNYRIKSYARILDINSARNALRLNGPLFISFPVYNHSVKMWHKTGYRLGGHAMTIIGYNKRGFIIRNSWGRDWGNKGNCIYPYDEFGMHWEIWTAVDDENSFVIKDTKKMCMCSLI